MSLPAERPAAATPALADQWEIEALEAIESVTTPEDAVALLAKVKLAEQAIRVQKLGADYEQRWGRVRLLGERRYGELLPKPEVGAPKGNVNAAQNNVDANDVVSKPERDARSQARKVFAVPEPVFTEYVESAPKPSRAGLLRETVAIPPAGLDPVKVDLTAQVAKLVSVAAAVDVLLADGAEFKRLTDKDVERAARDCVRVIEIVGRIQSALAPKRMRRVV